MKFEDLQKQWQDIKAPEETTGEALGQSLISQVEEERNKSRKAAITVSIAFAVTFVVLGRVGWEIRDSNLTLIGMALIFGDMIAALVFIWKMSLNWGKQVPDEESLVFIDKSLKGLRFRKKVGFLIMPFYILILVLGLNLVYLGSMGEMDMNNRIIAHSLATFGTIGIWLITLWYQKRKVKKEVDPLIENLERIRLSLFEK